MRIDAAGEECFEPLIDAGTAEPFLDERVETEPWPVTFVEHDGMAQRDRLAVVRILGEQIEQRARTRAILLVPLDGGGSIESQPCILIRNGLK